MAKFDAGTAVESMDFDFTAYGGSKGTIPEPTNEQVEQFLQFVGKSANRIREMATVAEQAEMQGLSDDEILALGNQDEEIAREMTAGLYEAIVAVCSGIFTVEEVKRLPFRIQNALAAWIARELNPESNGTVTKR